MQSYQSYAQLSTLNALCTLSSSFPLLLRTHANCFDTTREMLATNFDVWDGMGGHITSSVPHVAPQGIILDRDALKGGPVSLSISQAGPGRNFMQPRTHLDSDSGLCCHSIP